MNQTPIRTPIFKNALLRLNRFFVLNFTADGIRWRFESLRTGKPFKQVVQEHSLMSPVTQVFLIHRRTGLLIKQVRQESCTTHDGDMVSGMLTAIQDFVNQYGAAADTVHVEPGGWIFPESAYGAPYFLKWVEPPVDPEALPVHRVHVPRERFQCRRVGISPAQQPAGRL